MKSKSTGKSLKKYVEFVLVRSLITGFKILPFRWRVFWFQIFLKIIFRISTEFRTRIIHNLACAFPDKDKAWHMFIARRNVLSLARMNAEFLQNPRMNSAFINRWIHYMPDRESLQKIFDKGGILVLGHLGSWEWSGVAISHISNSDLYVLAKRQKNPWSNNFIERNRASQNIKLIYTDENPRRVVTRLKSGALVAFIADQDAGPAAPFFPFLNRMAATYQGPSFFARLVPDVPIHFLFSHHDPDGRLIVEAVPFNRPLDLDARRQTAAYDRLFTYRWVKLLEKYIYDYPEDYYWLHRRWYSKPNNLQQLIQDWKSWEKEHGFKISNILPGGIEAQKDVNTG